MQAMLLDILKAILIGIMASLPIGPVSLLVMQKTFCYGRKAGFAAGIGSAVVDTMYALASLYAFLFFQAIFDAHGSRIMIVGGVLIVAVGFSMLLRKPVSVPKESGISGAKAVQYAFQAAGCALANPGALFYMFTLVALFRLDIGSSQCPLWSIVLAAFAGTLLWWFSFAYTADKLRANFKVKTLDCISRIAGAAVIVFGLVLVVRGITIL